MTILPAPGLSTSSPPLVAAKPLTMMLPWPPISVQSVSPMVGNANWVGGPGVVVGATVGVAVGATVGVAVGATVGVAVGATVGVAVGATVGVAVGAASPTLKLSDLLSAWLQISNVVLEAEKPAQSWTLDAVAMVSLYSPP